MARNLETTLVCLLDRGTQFLTRDVLVRLERGHTAIRPIGYGLSCILRPGKLVHLEISIITGPFKIRTGDVEMWARKHARINRLLEPYVGVRIDTAHRAHGRHAIRQIQARRREAHLQKKGRAVEAPVGLEMWAGNTEQMVVHTDDPGHDRVTSQVQYRGAVARGLISAG